MGTTGWTLRLDPWSAEYDASVLLTEAEEPAGAVDPRVETADWVPLRPTPAPVVPPVYFVDGVRRIDHRLRIVGPGTCFGLLGSFAVGACAAGVQPGVMREAISRLMCVGGGIQLPAFEAATSTASLVFEPHPVPENTPLSPLQGLQNAMRRAEGALACDLAASDAVVFLDGPLTFAESGRSALIGFVKRLLRSYLPGELAALLPRLTVGERTPLFLIADPVHARYSWYARIAYGRPIEDALTGVVRLETSAAAGLTAARLRADLSACVLPPFASDAARDPRAPQNLLPIGGLESRLRHLMGDPLIVRRAIEERLHREAVA